MTAPSMISPKSSAPKLIKFPETPKTFINEIANNIASGMTEATIKPARKFPSNRTRTKITINAPSIRFFETVEIALFTNFVRSKYTSISTPSGKVCLICSMRSLTCSITLDELAPFNIRTIPPTASPVVLYVNAP